MSDKTPTTTKSKRGRQTKLTPELQAQMVDALSKGATRRAACAIVGIHESTFGRWMRAGREASSGVQRAFRMAIEAAEGKNERVYASALHDICVGMDEDAKTSDRVRGLMFMLTHRHNWVQRTELSGPGGAPLEVRAVDFSLPDVGRTQSRIRQMREELAQRRRS